MSAPKPVEWPIVVRWTERLEGRGNSRGHSIAQARRTKTMRRTMARRMVVAGIDDVTTPAPRAPLPAGTPIPKRARYLREVRLVRSVVVTLTRISPRAFDDDNLRAALKPLRDGIADAMGSDDRNPKIVWRYQERYGGPRVHEVEVIVQLEPKLDQLLCFASEVLGQALTSAQLRELLARDAAGATLRARDVLDVVEASGRKATRKAARAAAAAGSVDVLGGGS